MPKESLENKRIRAAKIVRALDKLYPDNPTLLDWWNDPFKLVIAVSLAAQTTDASVNKVTPELWRRYPTVGNLAYANLEDVAYIIRTTGFYRNKAKNCIACAKMVLEEFGGVVPQNMNDLMKLPGVGRKTANVVMSTAFGKCEGVAVDTHVFRIVHRLGLASAAADSPNKTEVEILRIFPKSSWIKLNHQLVRFGRETCVARGPKCEKCEINKLCCKIL